MEKLAFSKQNLDQHPPVPILFGADAFLLCGSGWEPQVGILITDMFFWAMPFVELGHWVFFDTPKNSPTKSEAPSPPGQFLWVYVL